MKKVYVVLFFSFLLSGCGSLTKLASNISGVKNDKKELSPIWSLNFDPYYVTGNLPIALQSPVIQEGVLYFGSNQQEMIAFNLDSGKNIWKKNDGSEYHSYPIIYKDMILYGTEEGLVFARDKNSGETIYSVALGAAVETPGSISNGRIFFQTRNHRIFALDIATGKILWAYKRSIPYMTTLQGAATPLIDKDKVIVGFADGYLCAFSIDEGVLLWEKKIAIGNKFIDVDLKPVLKGGNLYVFAYGEAMSVISLETGNLIQKYDYRPASMPVALSNDRYLIGTVEGQLLLVDDVFSVKKTFELSSGAITSIVKWNDRIVLAGHAGELILLSSELKELERKHLGHSSSAVFGELVADSKYLALISSRNRLYVFKSK